MPVRGGVSPRRLWLTDRLKNLVDANNDPVGRALEEERLPKRIHLPKTHE